MNQEPRHDDVLNRARGLHESGRHVEARSLLLELESAGITDTSVYRLLARVQRALDEPVQEARALEQALASTTAKTAADDKILWTRLGAVRAWLGDPSGALAAFQRVLTLAPEDEAALQGMARAHLALQDFARARRSAEALQQNHPHSSFSHLFAGHVHKARGNKSDARDCYRRSLELQPASGEALYNLVDLEEPAPNSALAAQVEDLADREDLAVADRINAIFAHARILDKAGEYRQAFARFRQANDLARDDLAGRGNVYERFRVEKRVTRTMQEYPPGCFVASSETSVDLTPVFIVGLPRSGTTLIEQILVSHGQVESAGEVVFARECEQKFRRDRAAAGRTGAVNPDNPVDAELLECAREEYLERLFERDLEGPLVVDKLPANFEIAGFLRLMFPVSPILWASRDPSATCFSLYCANFTSHEPWYHDFDHLQHFYGQYSKLMSHWLETIPAPFVTVRYEQLVQDPTSQIPALLQALDLPFDRSCLEPHRLQRPVFTASHDEVRRPIYTSSISHWKHYAEWLPSFEDNTVAQAIATPPPHR